MDRAYFKIESSGRKQRAICKATGDALLAFCEQQPEFEQAIIQSGSTFTDCLDSVCDGIGDACSDLEIYRKAVRFYFPVADIKFHMTIDLSGNNGAEDPPITMTTAEPEKQDTMRLSLDSLLDW